MPLRRMALALFLAQASRFRRRALIDKSSMRPQSVEFNQNLSQFADDFHQQLTPQDHTSPRPNMIELRSWRSTARACCDSIESQQTLDSPKTRAICEKPVSTFSPRALAADRAELEKEAKANLSQEDRANPPFDG